MNLEYKKIDTQSPDFEEDFREYEEYIFKILQDSYDDFYGNDYHKNRIIEGKVIIYLALDNQKLDDQKIVGLSYVKRSNCRRGGTVVFPPKCRNKGIAQKLIELSLQDIPNQHTILSTNLKKSSIMLHVIQKMGFKKATSEKEIKGIVGKEEYENSLSNFQQYGEYFVFDRKSTRRQAKRKSVTLFYI